MGGKSKSGQQEVNEYLLSQHIGFCYTLDYVTRMAYGEKTFWKGSVTTQQEININKPDLFGGPKKEGGVSGVIHVLLGKLDQVLPDALATRLGRVSGLKSPGFRGITSLFFTGQTGGFSWQSNTPYLKPVWLTGIRAPKGVGLDTSVSLLFETVEESEIIPVDDVWKYLEGDLTTEEPPEVDAYVDPDFDDSAWLTGRQPFANATHPFSGSFPSTPNTVIPTQRSVWLRKKVTVPKPGERLEMTIFADNECTIWWNGIKAGYASVQLVAGVVTPTYIHYPPYELIVDSNWQIRIKIPGELVLETNFVAGYFQDDAYNPGVGVDYFAAGIALIQPGGTTEEIRADANPAHIIYEVMTNTDFGLGDSPDLFDIDSFNDCAQKLYDEKLMLSMQWTRQSTVEDFNNEVLKHINAVVFTNPRNGLHTLRLIRGGYDESTLRQLDDDNGTITRFSRRVWGQTTNEIAVTWTNPLTEKEETVTVQDLSNISIQGKIITSSRNYYGVRSRALATELAYRELRLAASPICTAEMELNRAAWDLLPGDVISLSSDDYGLTALPMRVGVVDYGQIGSSTMRITLTEDIFALPISHFEVAPPSPWNPGGTPPTPVFSKFLFTLPAYATANLASLSYPSAYMGIAAQAPTADAYSFDLTGQTTAANGDVEWTSKGTLNFTSKAILTEALRSEASTELSAFTAIVGEGPTVAGFVLIGAGEDTAEFALVQSYNSGSKVYNLKRGVLDTVPKVWPAGTKLWFISNTSFAYDTTLLAAGIHPQYKLLTNSSKGQLSAALAPITTGVVTDRPHLPLRPANFQVGNVAFGQTVVSSTSSTVPVSWANRNRLTEDSIVLDWTASNTTPEDGQTTTLVICDEDMAQIGSVVGLTGTTHTLSLTPYIDKRNLYVFGYSERDGLRSLQGHQIRIIHLGGEDAAFEPNLLNPNPVVLLAIGDKFLISRVGLNNRIGFYTYQKDGTEVKYLSSSSASNGDPYLTHTTLYAVNDTDGFVGLMRAQGNIRELRKMIWGRLPNIFHETSPSFMPDNPPIGFWWTGTEFRAYLFNKTIWSSPTGSTWQYEGVVVNGIDVLPTAQYFSGAYIVVIGTKLAVRYQNQVLYCANTDGLIWSQAEGDIATLPTATYTSGVTLFSIASNGSRGVIVGVGYKPADYTIYGLVYTTTDGLNWSLIIEEAFLGANNWLFKDSGFNYGDCLDGTKFTSFLMRLVFKPDGIAVYQPDEFQSIHDFGSGVELIYPGKMVLGDGKAGESIGVFKYTGADLNPFASIFWTDDFQDSTEVPWGDVPPKLNTKTLYPMVYAAGVPVAFVRTSESNVLSYETYESSDGGDTFHYVFGGDTAPISDNSAFVAVLDSGVYISVDNTRFINEIETDTFNLVRGVVGSVPAETTYTFTRPNIPCGITSDGTRFIIFLDNDEVFESTDGLSWTSLGFVDGVSGPLSIYHSSGVYVLKLAGRWFMSYIGAIYYTDSDDPVSGWTIATLPTTPYAGKSSFRTITEYAGNLFCMGFYYDPTILTNVQTILKSTDLGSTWTISLDNATLASDVFEIGGILIAIGYGFTGRTNISADGGDTWTQPSNGLSLVQIKYPLFTGDRIFYSVPNPDALPDNVQEKLIWTTDGLTFTDSFGFTGANDPHFENVVLLINAAGVDGSFGVFDLSNSDHAITVSGSTQIENDIQIFGLPTIKFFGGPTDYLSIADNADFDFGTGDFTIEVILRPSASYPWWIMGKGDAASAAGSSFSLYNSGTWDFYHGGSATSVPSITYTAEHSYYWAVVRSGTTIKNYKGEIDVDETTTLISTTPGDIDTNAINTTTAPLRIGQYATGGFPGYVSAIRITKGVARDVSLVPTGQFPTY